MKKVIDIDEAKNKLISMNEFRHYKNYINDTLAGDFACELINLLNGYKEEPVQKWRKAEFPRDWGEEVYFGVAEVAGTLDGFCKRENKFIGSGCVWKICQILDDSEGGEEEVKDVCDGCEAELKDGEYCDNTDCKLFWKATKEPQALQQRIEAQFPDKRVEVLVRDEDAKFLQLAARLGYLGHTEAPSLKGFAGFVYEHDKGVFTENLNACVRGYKEVKVRFPVAVLFEADK